MHQVGDQPRLYYDERSTNHQHFTKTTHFSHDKQLSTFFPLDTSTGKQKLA